MRCVNCKKMVPGSSTKCPYCGGEVSDEVEVQNPINFDEPVSYSEPAGGNDAQGVKGEVASILNDPMSLLTDPKYKKILYVVGGFLVFIIIIFVMSLFKGSSKPKAGTYKSYSKLINKVEDFLYDNYFENSFANSGKFEIAMKYNGNEYQFTGDFGYNLKDKIGNVKAIMKDPKENKGGIIVNYKKFELNFGYNKGTLAVKSDQLFNDTLLFEFDDPDGIITNSKYDPQSVVESYGDALIEALKKMNYTTTTEKIELFGKKQTLEKLTFKLDSKTKKKFYTLFYDTLAEDSTFTSELAKMRGVKSEEIEKIYNNYSSSAEFMCSKTGCNTVVSLYTTKKGNAVRLEIDNKDDSKLHKKYRIDLNEVKYYFTYMENDEVKQEGTFMFTTEDINDVIVRKYEITYKGNGKDIAIDLDVKLDGKSKVTPGLNSTGIKYIDLTDEQIEDIKEKLGEFIKNTKFVDKLKDYFVDKCKVATECVCKGETCNCLYNSNVVVCPNPDAKQDDTVDEDEINKTTTTTTTTSEEPTSDTTDLSDDSTTTTTISSGDEQTTTTTMVNQP